MNVFKSVITRISGRLLRNGRRRVGGSTPMRVLDNILQEGLSIITCSLRGASKQDDRQRKIERNQRELALHTIKALEVISAFLPKPLFGFAEYTF